MTAADSAFTETLVLEASQRLAGRIRRTPVLNSPLLDRRLGARLYCKAEPLQLTGSFKIRGALNRLICLTDAERARGVVAFSAGNHGQALACAGAQLGAPVTIFMPSDAPRTKITKTQGFGADVRFYDRVRDDRVAITQAFATASGAIPVSPYDDHLVMAGGGTAALELIDELASTGIALDRLYVPCGGGGLVAGSATIAALRSPTTRVISVEPEGFDDTARSLAAGQRTANPPGRASLADALLTTIPGELTFPVNAARLAGALAVTDDEIATAVRTAFTEYQVIVEPGGVVGLAAACRQSERIAGEAVGVILTGGNVDADRFASIISARGLETGQGSAAR